jgi:FKBP-type peptidyl-prolyl cis-trans isomerase
MNINLVSMKKWNRLIAMLFFGSFVFMACTMFSDYPGFKKANSGLLYKFYEKNEGRKAQIGDYITVQINYRSNEDSLLFEVNGNVFPMELVKPVFAGDINEALAMMSIGDSASFIIRADSFLLKNSRVVRLPDFIDEDSRLIFDVRLLNVQSLEELELEKELKRLESINRENGLIQAYLKENKIGVSPEPSGLYFISLLEGSGKSAARGNRVSVHYIGKFLDGKVFDSSLKRGKPIDFDLGRGQVIPGWEEGIAKMKKGGKAIFIIPSELGYGSGRGEIPPYTPLLFEVELIDVKLK